MKVGIVVFVVGEKYIYTFNNFFRKNLEKYCEKYGYELIIENNYIREEKDMNHKKFFWQRLLIPNKYKDYDFIVSLDSDIYINLDAPPLPFSEIPEGKVAAVNERKYIENYEWRENVQDKNGWEKTGKDWYRMSGEDKNYNDHINGGLVIYQPKYHGQLFLELYDKNICNWAQYHQDDQSFLSSYLIDNKMIHWIDPRFNRIWYFWREIFYPQFDSYPVELKKLLITHYTKLNYFSHLTSRLDLQYL